MVKLGFIGCGGMARYHAGIITSSVKDIKIIAGADISSDVLSGFSETVGVSSIYATYTQMLAEADINAVCVALPTSLHHDAVLAAAESGKHVFCEKPMARSMAECDEMIVACKQAGVTLMIGQVRRFDNDWGTWKELVTSGVIGRPVIWRQISGSSGPGGWFMDEEMGGGPFLDGCVHNWDFANLVFGKPLEAIGSLVRFADTTALDTGSVIVRYTEGDEVMLSWSWALPKGTRSGGANEILGPKGVIKFPGTFPLHEYEADLDEEHFGGYLVDTGQEKRVVSFAKKDMFAAEWQGFRDAVLEGRPPLVTGEIGREALKVGLAVLKAGASRKPVAIGEIV